MTCGADGLGEVRPLAMDIDTEDGSRVYLTLWSAGNKIYCQRRATSDLSVEGTTEVGSATEAEIADKTYFVVPRCPHVPAETGFGNWLWLFGRWNDGAVKHLAFSNNGGATLINKGSGSWDSNHRIGALDVLGDGNTVYAFINHATTPRLWTTPDGGTTWQDLNSVPFNVEFDALSRATWSEDEEFLIGNSAAAAQMAAWLGKPYTDDWEDATGDPGLPTEAGFISAIIWV